ncbi:threonine/serine exporter family protein [Streptomyces sp. P9-A4]|uniref:threonine/serine exporter family protein n=1 Tax=Streptomyces sp. P9-A4 TaxID=3072285 RepID=UPI002FCADFA2
MPSPGGPPPCGSGGAAEEPSARTALPVVAAILVTTASLRWAGPLLHEAPSVLYVPPLIAFLPGAALTLGAIELATGAALSGIARLAGAANVLFPLALGILIGTELLNPRPSSGPAADPLGAGAPWVGVLVGAGLQRRPRLSIGEPAPASTPTAPEPAAETPESPAGP